MNMLQQIWTEGERVSSRTARPQLDIGGGGKGGGVGEPGEAYTSEA